MSKTVVIYTYDSSLEEKRAALRPKHLAYLRKLLDEGKLDCGGAWIDEPQSPGALLVMNTDNPKEALDWLERDPNRVEHIVTAVETHQWSPAVGSID